ncbi:coiled-coil domain-containing protein [Brevibacillus sp. TJ4]|uniref:coiled-coil domain-containing protein n=1 Tax=Brevibacillus sp. TJ4 TaxID=3234853 RepID=UPI0037D40B98
MRKILLVLLLIALPVTASAQEQSVPLEQIILQQHLTQKELERTLQSIKAEEAKTNSDIARLEIDLQRQKLKIQALRRQAGKVAHAYYTGERPTLLTLLFEAENFNQLLLMFDFYQFLYQRDMNRLEAYHTEQEKMNAMRTEQTERLETLATLRKTYEGRLAEMLAVQAEKERNVQMLDDPSSVQALMDHLLIDWQKRGLPAFQKFFATLSEVMLQVPELATSERIRSNGLFSHTFTITQDDFNQFLASKNELFEQSRFVFEDNQLIVEGSYDHMQLKITGNYELVSPTHLKFHINSLHFDGFELPQATVEEMEKMYDLGFYPELISPNVFVERLTLADEQLRLHLKLQFGFFPQ